LSGRGLDRAAVYSGGTHPSTHEDPRPDAEEAVGGCIKTSLLERLLSKANWPTLRIAVSPTSQLVAHPVEALYFLEYLNTRTEEADLKEQGSQ
jgi:hypothetical protein